MRKLALAFAAMMIPLAVMNPAITGWERKLATKPRRDVTRSEARHDLGDETERFEQPPLRLGMQWRRCPAMQQFRHHPNDASGVGVGRLVTGDVLTGNPRRGQQAGITVDAATVKAWEPVRKAAEDAVRAVPGVVSALVALTAERAATFQAFRDETAQRYGFEG